MQRQQSNGCIVLYFFSIQIHIYYVVFSTQILVEKLKMFNFLSIQVFDILDQVLLLLNLYGFPTTKPIIIPY